VRNELRRDGFVIERGRTPPSGDPPI